jgi:hypothetical protein
MNDPPSRRNKLLRISTVFTIVVAASPGVASQGLQRAGLFAGGDHGRDSLFFGIPMSLMHGGLTVS